MKKHKDFGAFLDYHPYVNIKLPQDLLSWQKKPTLKISGVIENDKQWGLKQI